MTIWHPRLDQRSGPRYLRIASALREDISSGALPAGTRLPTHRDLAETLGVTVGTVSRAYAEAARQKLISGEIGRGTYVRGEQRPEQMLPGPVEPDDGLIDLSLTRPVVDLEQLGLEATLTALARAPDAARLFDYAPNAGLAAHRRAAADWMSWWRGLKATEDRIVVTSGGQHGIAVVLSAVTQPGDVVLTECLTYPGLKGIAKVLHLELAPVAMDADGMVPDSLEAMAVHRGARLLYTVPTLHNPTTTVMPAERRAEIAALAQRLDLTVLEDDVNGLLLPEAPRPLAAWVPERSYVVSSLSKFLAPGLRIGHVLAPEGRAARVAAGVRATSIMTSPLLAELASRWLGDGTVERVVAGQQEEARTRQALAAKVLEAWEFSAQPHGFHLWLQLPEPWQTEDYVAQARERGVLISPASAFAVGRTAQPHAVRVGLGGVRPLARLEQGLRTLAEILGRPPGPIFSIV